MKFPVFLQNVQILMKERDWDQTELAHQVGSSQPSVSRWGFQSVPRGNVLANLAAIAGVDAREIVETPLKQARQARSASLPSGRKLTEVMEALLDSAGLPHLVDEYAPKLARLLPGLLADSAVPIVDQAFGQGKLPGGHVRDRAKGDPDKRP